MDDEPVRPAPATLPAGPARPPSGARIAAVIDGIRQRIATRQLTPGDRLPSVRATAATMRVSVSTVVEAYDRLAADGTIRSRPGSGHYVAAPLAPLSMAALGPRLDRAVDPFWVSRQSLESGDDALKPGCGWLPADWMPQEPLRRALRALARGDDATTVEYATPLGLPPLRQWIARRLAERGVDAAPDRIVLTDSGTQAIDLLLRFLLQPGDTVLVDDPCYFNFHALLRAHRADVVGVPMTPAGPDVARFAAVVDAARPRLYLTNAAIHNPTGAVLSPVVAHRVLKIADAAGMAIVEDDIFADLEATPAPRLAAFDGLQRVVQVGSFSKTVSASVRVGWIATRAEWIEGLTDLKIATSFAGGRAAEALVLGVLRDGGYRRHLEALQQRLAQARRQVVRRLRRLGIEPWIDDGPGLFLWCRLPDGVDAAALGRAALAERVVLAPGDAFSVSRSAASWLRFNVAQSLDERLEPALRRALAAPGVRAG